MAKTNPIGVRFEEELLKKLKEENIAPTPQKALNFLTELYFDAGKDEKKGNNKKSQSCSDNENILKKISEIENETIPKERDTFYGRKSWQVDQKKRIDELRSLLN